MRTSNGRWSPATDDCLPRGGNNETTAKPIGERRAGQIVGFQLE